MKNALHSFDKIGLSFLFKFSALCILLIVLAYFAPLRIFGFTEIAEIKKASEFTQSALQEIDRGRELRLVYKVRGLAQYIKENQTLETSSIKAQNPHKLIPKQGKFMMYDLAQMKAYLYKDGAIEAQLEILSKGKPGSHWETPTGLYQILNKEPLHFSSIGEVYMPHSMQFYGNYFIHGWPYYTSGQMVPQGYSGGCIRLSPDGALKAYEFADKGMEIFVYDEQENDTLIQQNVRLKNISPPNISARNYIFADINTGQVFLEQGSYESVPIASITKLITALVANETISFDKVIKVESASGEFEEDYGSVQYGDRFAVGDLLYPLLLESNNAVANSFALYYGKNNFIKWMNNKARAIGMRETSFEDSSGISDKNVSTARDLYLLAKYLKQHKSFVLNISKQKLKKITSENDKVYEFKNLNSFVDYDNFVGGKTGFTNLAKETMISLFDVPLKSSTSTVLIVVLGSSDRYGDTLALLDWFPRALVNED